MWRKHSGPRAPSLEVKKAAQVCVWAEGAKGVARGRKRGMTRTGHLDHQALCSAGRSSAWHTQLSALSRG
jgi:hypothetical protein